MALPAAAATPAEGQTDSLPAVDTAALTAPVRAALSTSPVVSVPQDAAWDFATPQITVAANPKPVVVERPTTATSSSRSTSRSYVTDAPIPQSVAGNAVLEIAARYVGVPYLSGGTTPDGFDCSGFTSYVYAQLGITLPRISADQQYAGVVVSAADALPGDLIWSPGHVGIYAGDGMQIDSPRPGKTVQFRSIWQSNPIYVRVTG
jgi:cell wall-associated NlpC family hydrolase